MDDFFNNTGFESDGILHLTPKQAWELCKKGAVVIDVREEYMNRFKMLDVPEVIYCPFKMLAEHYHDLPQDKPLIFADASGIHSKEAVKLMLAKEYLGIANLAGGLVEWERDGLPLIIDHTEQLSGSCVCQLRPRNRKG
jgi:rhodanese-related sulfurtransferase